MSFLPNLSLLCITDVQVPPKRDLEENDSDIKNVLSMFYAVTQRLKDFEEFVPFEKIHDPSKDEAFLEASRSSERVVVAAMGLYAELFAWADSFVPTREHFLSPELQSALRELDESAQEVNKSGMSVNLQSAWNAAVEQSDFTELTPESEVLKNPTSPTKPASSSEGTLFSDGEETKEDRDSRLMPKPKKMSIWAKKHFAYREAFKHIVADYKEGLLYYKALIKRSKSGRTMYQPSLPAVDPLATKN